MKRVIATLVLSAVASSAMANPSVAAYVRNKGTPGVESYIQGLADGLLGAAALHRESKVQPPYCLPPDLPFGGREMQSIIDEEIKIYKGSSLETMPLFKLAVIGLVKKYPCK